MIEGLTCLQLWRHSGVNSLHTFRCHTHSRGVLLPTILIGPGDNYVPVRIPKTTSSGQWCQWGEQRGMTKHQNNVSTCDMCGQDTAVWPETGVLFQPRLYIDTRSASQAQAKTHRPKSIGNKWLFIDVWSIVYCKLGKMTCKPSTC